MSKRFKNKISIILIFALVLGMTYVPDKKVNEEPKVKISSTKKSLGISETATLKMTGTKKVSWSSSKKRKSKIHNMHKKRDVSLLN